MENFENGGYDRNEQDDRREYGNQQFNDERPRRSYNDYSERGHRQYTDHRDNRGGYGRNYGDNSERPSRNYGNPDRPRRQYNSEDGGNYNQRRNNFNSDRPHRQYNNNDEGGSYGQRRNNFNPDRQYRNYNNDERPHRNYGDNNRPRRQFNNNENGNSFDGQRRNNFGYDKPRKYSSGYTERTFSSYNPDRPVRGTKLRPRKNKPKENVPVESGIDKMINRNPQLNDMMYSDNDMVNVPVKETIRLNKFIANSGICSRREADTFIQAGVVTVNGKVVTELGSKINIFTDDVRFNDQRLKGEPKVYIIMNKPKGYVTTTSDPHADKSVMDLIKGCTSRVFPVGRLDKNTTGVLMFTNDGEIAEKLTHPSYDKKKIYQVSLNKNLSQEDYEKVLAGVTLTDGEVAADALEYIDERDHKKLGIEIHSGKNRIVRRIFETIGYEVKSLDRVYFAGLTKKGIKRGGWRYLTDREVNILRMGAYN